MRRQNEATFLEAITQDAMRIHAATPIHDKDDHFAGLRLSFKPYPDSTKGIGDVLTLDGKTMKHVVAGLEPLTPGQVVVLHRRDGEILAITTMSRHRMVLYLADRNSLMLHDEEVANASGTAGHVSFHLPG